MIQIPLAELIHNLMLLYILFLVRETPEVSFTQEFFENEIALHCHPDLVHLNVLWKMYLSHHSSSSILSFYFTQSKYFYTYSFLPEARIYLFYHDQYQKLTIFIVPKSSVKVDLSISEKEVLWQSIHSFLKDFLNPGLDKIVIVSWSESVDLSHYLILQLKEFNQKDKSAQYFYFGIGPKLSKNYHKLPLSVHRLYLIHLFDNQIKLPVANWTLDHKIYVNRLGITKIYRPTFILNKKKKFHDLSYYLLGFYYYYFDLSQQFKKLKFKF